MKRPEHNKHRARVYRVLARLFRCPEAGAVAEVRERELPELEGSLRALGADDGLLEHVARLDERLASLDGDGLTAEWQECFEVSGRRFCALGELAYTIGSPQEAWLTGYRLADIAGFYHAFGVQLAPESERADHLAVELEFMHLLAVKEAHAEETGQPEGAGVCHDAAVTFLREHLGRWTGAVRARLEEGGGALYPVVAGVLDAFVAFDAGLLDRSPPAGGRGATAGEPIPAS